MNLKIANAPCSWGVLEFGLDGKTDTYSKVLNEMRETGYSGTELGDWGFMPTDPAKLKKELAARNLNLVGAFVPVAFANRSAHEDGAERALRIATLIKAADPDHARIVLSDDNGKNHVRTRNTGRIKKRHQLTEDEWITYAEGVELTAKKIMDATGVPSVFHHHCAGFVETPDEIENLLSKTDPELVNLCFDTGHYEFGGGDAVNGVKRFSGRLGHVHFKDFDRGIFNLVVDKNLDYFEAVGNGIFCELGLGSIPFHKVVDELAIQGYNDWIVVEQDVLPGMGKPKESAQRNRDYLESIGI